MMIVWDEWKRIANLEKHGLDFADLTLDFFQAARIGHTRGNRYMAIGRVNDGTISVVFAALGTEAISVISMRAANSKERRLL